MLDLLSVITKCIKTISARQLTILEIPTVTDDCIDKLSDLIEQGGESFNEKFDAHGNQLIKCNSGADA